MEAFQATVTAELGHLKAQLVRMEAKQVSIELAIAASRSSDEAMVTSSERDETLNAASILGAMVVTFFFLGPPTLALFSFFGIRSSIVLWSGLWRGRRTQMSPNSKGVRE
ncbi:hypothetical protein B484DRAFT_264107 [Ochromonadaceae sp. CCMP2298]|nr:hypothetical protein B484DRAFT_264107 [Ochromonadaceae sp. CCMP2298]